MPYGWTQQSIKWTVWKNNNDTIITYNFTKVDLTNFRIYVTSLEEISELYTQEVKQSLEKDILLKIKDEKIALKDSTILANKNYVLYQNKELERVDKINKDLQIKYQNQSKAIPYLMGGSALVTLILCLLIK